MSSIDFLEFKILFVLISYGTQSGGRLHTVECMQRVFVEISDWRMEFRERLKKIHFLSLLEIKQCMSDTDTGNKHVRPFASLKQRCKDVVNAEKIRNCRIS